MSKVDVVIIGCGVPGRSMGWYHALNILDGNVPSANLSDVVEPYFLGAGKDTDGGVAFAAFAAANPAVNFWPSLEAMPSAAEGAKKVALIAGRTADNPALLREVIDKGATCVYLEKPGAPTVGELESMAAYAKEKGVPVYMGYNKNVTKYVTLALEAEASAGAGAHTAFYHNNAYTKEGLTECFERNSEGMLKNMAVHELCLLVTFYGVSAENIASVEPDEEYSSCQTLGGFTDFDKIGFTVTTTEGKKASVYADRCGGSYAEAVVKEADGAEVFRSVTPDAELNAVFEAKVAEHPDWMPYFILQHDDYVTLKERVCAACVAGGAPEGVASLETAIETLKVAEKLTPLLQDKLLKTGGEKRKAADA